MAEVPLFLPLDQVTERPTGARLEDDAANPFTEAFYKTYDTLFLRTINGLCDQARNAVV